MSRPDYLNQLAVFFVIALFMAAASSASKSNLFLYSELGCVDTVEIGPKRFDWDNFRYYNFAFFQKTDTADGYCYLIKPLSKGESIDLPFLRYREDWPEYLSSDSLRIILGHDDSIGLRVIAAHVVTKEPDGSDSLYRLFKPDLSVLETEDEYRRLQELREFPVLIYSDIHYPSLTFMDFHTDPEPVYLHPIRYAGVRASFGVHHLRRFSAKRRIPGKRVWKADLGWAKVPILKSGNNEFRISKFGFWPRKAVLSAGELDSVYLKPWLYFNLPLTWVDAKAVSDIPWPTDIVFGLDLAGAIPGLYQKIAPAGLDYQLVVSPFPFMGKAGVSWQYGDLWVNKLYGLYILDSNPIRPFGIAFIAESEISGKIVLGRRLWKALPFFIKGGYGLGKVLEPSIYRYRFIERENGKSVEGSGYYLSAGLELWFLRMGLFRPTVEAGIIRGSGLMRSPTGEVISESDKDDDNTFGFFRINISP